MHGNEKENVKVLPILSAYDFIKDKPCLKFYRDDPLYDIVNEMRKSHNYSALVVNEDDLVGLLTEHDILLFLLAGPMASHNSEERVSKAFNILKAGDVMIPFPATVSAEVTLDNYFEEIMADGYRYMPVVDRDGHPLGILSRTDLIQYMQLKNRKELETKDMMLSYLMHHENYGCV